MQNTTHNKPLRFDVEQSIPARFAQVAEQFPDAPAIAGISRPLTYAQLAAEAGAIADAIRAKAGDAQPGQISERAAIIAGHNASLLTSVLGVLVSGRAVVVLNPSNPPARLRQIIEDTQPQVLLADRDHQEIGAQIIPDTRLMHIEDALQHHDTATPSSVWDRAASIPATALAWLISTSGSTGRPKSVMQTHRNILHNVCRLSFGMSITPPDRIGLTSALSTGQGLSTLWCALCNGAACCPFPVPERGVSGLNAWIDLHRISVLVVAGTVFRQLIKTLPEDQRLASIRMLRLSAESATTADFLAFQKHFSPHAFLFHAFSTSETGSITQHLMRPSDPPPAGAALPVGRLSPEMEILLVDESGKPVAPGEPGEIIARSPYISPGYWNNPILTSERFSAPEGLGGARLYRTGDRVRQNAAGVLEYVGRKDFQIKIHGQRVELGEIEAAISALPQVERAAVISFQPPGAPSPQVAAFILKRPDQPVNTDELRAALRDRLPSYMVPARIAMIDALPLTPSGKIDRQALRAMLADPEPREEPLPAEEKPQTRTEDRLAAIWAVTLRRGQVGRSSDFFSLGGDSLSAATIAAVVFTDFGGVTLDLRAFADHPRLSDLAAFIDAMPPPGHAAAGPIPRAASARESAPLSFTQERIWNLSREPGGSAGYAVTSCHLIRGPLDVGALKYAMAFLHARHPMMRSTFHATPTGPVQRCHLPEDAPFDMPVQDVSSHPDPAAAASRFFRELSAMPFDLAKLPLLRYFLLRLSADEYWLLRINHHILCDGTSWKIYFRELAAAYEARVSGKAPPFALAADGISFADYAVWQRQRFKPEAPEFAAAIDWWTERFKPRPPKLTLPFRRSKSILGRKRNVTAQDGIQWWGMPDSAARILDKYAAHGGATYYMARLAAFLSFLSRQTGQQDLVVGSYAGNRARLETQTIFGDFSNLVTLRFTLKQGAPFAEHLAAVKQEILNLQTPPRAEIPFEHLRTLVRSRGGDIPAPTAIILNSDHMLPLRFAGLEMTWRERISDAIPWGFTLAFTQNAESSANRAWFDPRLYDPDKVRGFVNGFLQFLEKELPAID